MLRHVANLASLNGPFQPSESSLASTREIFVPPCSASPHVD